MAADLPENTAPSFANSGLTGCYRRGRASSVLIKASPKLERSGFAEKGSTKALTFATDHLEHRARVIIVKTQIQFMQVGDGRRDAEA